MGRKKIKIARIQDDRNRSVTYLKRKAGLMKKAHELAVLTSSDVAVIVFGQNGKLSEFCSGDIDRILLRYTEHTGPVERKGPEHYQNDDDDGGSDDDNMGDDGEDGDGEGDSGDGHGEPSSSGYRGAGSNGGGYGGTDASSSRSHKRKAPSGKQAMQTAAHGQESRSTSPAHNAPIIKVEGEYDESVFADDNSLDKGALKAAIIQNSIRKPRSNSHHGGRSSNARPQGFHQHSRSEQNILSPGNNSPLPPAQRPNTADMMRGPNAFVFPPPQQQRQGAHGQFPYHSDPQHYNPDMHAQNNPFLSPQVWGSNAPTSTTPSMSPQNASLHPEDAMSYGELARGASAGHSPISSQHLHAPVTPGSLASSPLPSPEIQAMGHNAAFGGNANLLPLAHPALREHPQYEAYMAKLRQQQQEQQSSMHSRNASMPAFPTSQNFSFLTAPDASPMQHASPAGSAPPPHSPAHSAVSFDHEYADRRSASFGGGDGGLTLNSGAPRFTHQSSVSDVGPMTSSNFLDPFSAEKRDAMGSASQYTPSRPSSVMSAHSHHSMQEQQQQQQQPQQHGGSQMGNAPPPPYPSSEDQGPPGNSMQQSSDNHLSNAAFNDLMGSILGDMSGSEAQGNHSFNEHNSQAVSGAMQSGGMAPMAQAPGSELGTSAAMGSSDVKTQFNVGSDSGQFRPFVGNM